MEGTSVVVEYVIVLQMGKKNMEWVKKWEKNCFGKKVWKKWEERMEEIIDLGKIRKYIGKKVYGEKENRRKRAKWE